MKIMMAMVVDGGYNKKKTTMTMRTTRPLVLSR
jgi:hypothetical protein